MNYIPFPRLDKNNHVDLIAWRNSTVKKINDWKELRSFLHDCTKISNANDALPKCWYSEMPQGDENALDVEHFRPKDSGNPLSITQIKQIEKFGNIKYEQSPNPHKYDWLQFDYRNYRLVTAKTNRAGAKHIYFPIAKGTNRLESGQFPWETSEYSYFLDPTNKDDSTLLYVRPNGEISPITPRTQVTETDFRNLPDTWRNDAFNYLRSIVTIKLFRLDDKIFVAARKKVFEDTTLDLRMLDMLICENPHSGVIAVLISRIVSFLLPSAPFSLAAKSALLAYIPKHYEAFGEIISKIISSVDTEIDKLVIDWRNP